MHYVVDQLPRELSKLWAQLISPRPLALISTRSAAGVPNIAPYNSYAGLATYPAMLGVSFSQRDGQPKHTLVNIKATGEFVINLVPRFLGEIMNQSAEGTEVTDDFTRLGVTPIDCESVKVSRIAESPASLECRVVNTMLLPPSRCEFVVALIVGVTIRDEFVMADGGFDPLAADLLASVGPEDYVSVNGETLHLPKTWG